MPDLLNTSLTGMIAFQRALEVTGHNIANANTPGYSRQVAEFSSRIGSGSGNLYIGGGTQISTVKRIFDAMQVSQLRTSTTSYTRFAALNELAGRMDTLLADANTGLNTSLQSFFNGLQDVSNDPSSIPTRQALLGEATGLASRFQSLDNQLAELESEVNQRLELAVTDINRLAQGIADLNDQIALASGSGQQPNDLLDQRDRLVMALSEQVAVSTTTQDDGAMNVFIGNGQSLVVGGTTRELAVTGDEFDPTALQVVYRGTAGATALDTSLTGGNLGGLLEYRSTMLNPARQALGQTAAALVSKINEQHASGMDLRGNLGGDFFSVAPPTVLYSGSNTGTGTVIAEFGDMSQLTGADYMLEYDGSAYSLTRVDTGAVVPMSGTGTTGNPLVADGLRINVGGVVPAAGDRMMIRSGRDVAASIRNVISDPQSLAFAAPTRSAISAGNIGNATVSPATVVDPANPSLFISSVIEFTGPATYSINGSGSYGWIDGQPITVNGSSITISGAPAVGDQFTIDANFGASGDNANGLLMADIQSLGILDGGTISINENYGQLVSGVGSATRQVQANLDAAGVVRSHAEEAAMATSGVNLDEEAAKLIRYQQSYQAVAQVVSVASTLFDSLLAATRR
jgi:flagellar hook-associated protein 1 FlgK